MTSPHQKSRSERLEAALRFDEIAVEDAAIVSGNVKITAGKPFKADTSYFDAGARYESFRRAAIDKALIECVAALENYTCIGCQDKHDRCYEYLACKAMRTLDTALEAAAKGEE